MNNGVTVIRNGSLAAQTVLEALHLNGNPLTTIEPGAFSSLHALRDLT